MVKCVKGAFCNPCGAMFEYKRLETLNYFRVTLVFYMFCKVEM